jgi:hypothetical protein
VAAAAAAAALAGTAWLREPRQGNAATEQR